MSVGCRECLRSTALPLWSNGRPSVAQCNTDSFCFFLRLQLTKNVFTGQVSVPARSVQIWSSPDLLVTFFDQAALFKTCLLVPNELNYSGSYVTENLIISSKDGAFFNCLSSKMTFLEAPGMISSSNCFLKLSLARRLIELPRLTIS